MSDFSDAHVFIQSWTPFVYAFMCPLGVWLMKFSYRMPKIIKKGEKNQVFSIYTVHECKAPN